jgi:hypothetical protein
VLFINILFSSSRSLRRSRDPAGPARFCLKQKTRSSPTTTYSSAAPHDSIQRRHTHTIGKGSRPDIIPRAFPLPSPSVDRNAPTLPRKRWRAAGERSGEMERISHFSFFSTQVCWVPGETPLNVAATRGWGGGSSFEEASAAALARPERRKSDERFSFFLVRDQTVDSFKSAFPLARHPFPRGGQGDGGGCCGEKPFDNVKAFAREKMFNRRCSHSSRALRSLYVRTGPLIIIRVCNRYRNPSHTHSLTSPS